MLPAARPRWPTVTLTWLGPVYVLRSYFCSESSAAPRGPECPRDGNRGTERVVRNRVASRSCPSLCVFAVLRPTSRSSVVLCPSSKRLPRSSATASVDYIGAGDASLIRTGNSVYTRSAACLVWTVRTALVVVPGGLAQDSRGPDFSTEGAAASLGLSGCKPEAVRPADTRPYPPQARRPQVSHGRRDAGLFFLVLPYADLVLVCFLLPCGLSAGLSLACCGPGAMHRHHRSLDCW